VRWPLEDFEGVFLRLADVAEQPELAGLHQDHPRMVHADKVCELLLTWCDVTDARVVNRLRRMASNASKPHQLQAIAEVFATPDTLVTNDPSQVLDFWEQHGRAIYKSTSGARSIVQELGDADLDRLARVAHCPTQFQAYVDGVDIRVHTLADGSAFATVIDSEATDYRYASRSGGSAAMHEVTLPDDTVDACLRLAARLGLDFAGIDLRIGTDGIVYCFEVNPSPAYSAFEAETGQPIALGLARYLAGIAA